MFFHNKIKTEGFIFKKKILLNKDILISLFTKDKGKILIIGKGTRKITSRRLSYLETANLVDLVLEENKHKFYLKEIDLISGFYKIKKDLKKINIIYNFFYILDKILPENQKELEVYNLIKNFFVLINKESDFYILNDLMYLYINKILIKLGFLKKMITKDKINDFLSELINEKIPSFII